ncbi:MAG: hypothetical protein JW894_08425 [Bacteroidales bacterium]|nr:hypothetical protein [Bacteroidales bacterium]
MSEKALRWIINIAGIVCLYAFLAIRFLPLFNVILLEKYIPEYWENTKWGELYYFNFIKHFRENNLPDYIEKYRFTEKHPDLQDADILSFGDSFFDFSRMTTFPEQLSDSLGKKVFYAREDEPLTYLEENKYTNGRKKYIIYETAERFLHDRFEFPQKSNYVEDNRSLLKRSLTAIRDFLFIDDTELLYSQLLNRSYFTTHIYSALSTIKFDVFGQITTTTPKYTLDYDTPWLFGGIQVGDTPRSFYYKHSQEEIDNYCDNIKKLSDSLKEKYNLELIFIIIPSKYTVYHTLINKDEYNNFIPRMYLALKERNIPVIEIYNEFIANRDKQRLYYGTDTHWTEEGLHIALSKTLQIFDTICENKYYAGIDTANDKKFNN